MRTATITATGLVALLALAGCGGNDDTAEAQEADTGAPVADESQVEPAAEPTPEPESDEPNIRQLIEQENQLFGDLLTVEEGSPEFAEIEAELDKLYETLEDEYGGIEEHFDNDTLPAELEALASVQFIRDLESDPWANIPEDAPIHDMESEEDIMRYMLDCDDTIPLDQCEAAYEDSVNQSMIEYDLEECREMVQEGNALMGCRSVVLPDDEFWVLYEETYGEPVPDQFR